jgi:hypothetical protein
LSDAVDVILDLAVAEKRKLSLRLRGRLGADLDVLLRAEHVPAGIHFRLRFRHARCQRKRQHESEERPRDELC